MDRRMDVAFGPETKIRLKFKVPFDSIRIASGVLSI